MTILHAATASTVTAQTNQTSQLAALLTPFGSGNVTVKVMSGATLLSTVVHGPWAVAPAAIPRSASLAARISRTYAAAGAPTRVVFCAGSLEIFEFVAGVGSGDVSFAAVVSALRAERMEGVTITATPTLPVTGAAPAPPPAINVTAGASSGTVGAGPIAGPTISAPIGNAAAVSWSITATPAGLTATPSSGTLAPGASVTPTLSSLIAAIYATTVNNTSGGTGGGSAGAVQFYAAPPAPTTATLSGPSAAVAGTSQSYVVTLNAPADQTYTVTWNVTGGTPASGTTNITSGNLTGTVLVSLPSAGTSSVDFTISPSITRAGNPRSVTVSASAPPPTPPGTVLANVTAYAPGPGTYPVTFGHPFKPGEMVAEIVADGWQMDVKNRWPDRSVKLAFLSKLVTFTGTSAVLPIGPGIPTLADDIPVSQLAASGLSVTVNGGALGSASWSGADWNAPHTVWLQGHTCLNVLYRKPIGSDPHAVADLDVRLYSNGDIDVVAYVRNGYLLKAAPGTKSGTFSLVINGSTVFGPSALDAGHHTRQPLLSGAALSYWVGGVDKSVTPKHDAAYLAGTGYVSAYLADTASSVEPPSLPNPEYGVSTSFEPWQQITTSLSNFSTVMGSGGGHKSIGIQPVWEAVALTNSTALAIQQMVRESYRFGRYSIHFAEDSAVSPVAERPFLMADHLTVSVDNSAIHGITDARGGGALPVPVPSGAAPHESARWTPSHQPASPLLAYLVTGRHWFMEECQYITNANWLANQPGRQGANSIYEPFELGGSSVPEMRKSAWCLRNLMIAALVTPDDDDNALHKDQYEAAVDANIANMHAKYVASPSNPFGLIETGSRSFTSGTATGMVAGGAQAWQYDFWSTVWGRAVAWRVGKSRASRKKASEFYSWVAQSIVGRLGTTAATEWLYRDLSVGLDQYDHPANYRLPWLWPGKNVSTVHVLGVGDTTTGTYPDYVGGTGPWWGSWGEMWDHMMGTQAGVTKVDGPLRGSYMSEPEGQFWNAFPAMVAAASLGIAGAAAGIARVRANANWAYLRSLVAGRYPTYSVETVALPLENFASEIPAVGMIENVNLTDAHAVDFERASGWYPGNLTARWWGGFGATTTFNIFTDIIQAYSGSVWNSGFGSAGALISNGGSDGAQLAQVAYGFDADSLSWWSVGGPRNLPPTFEWANYYQNGTGIYEQRPSNGNPRVPPSTEARDPVFYDHLWRNSYIKLANHSYLHNFIVPRANGGGKDGSLGLPCSSYSHDRGDPDPRNGKVDTFTPHIMSLNSGKAVRAVTEPVAYAGDTDGFKGFTQTISVVDTKAGRVWFLRNGLPHAQYLTLTGQAPFPKTDYTIPKVSGGNADYTVTANSTWVHVPEADAFVGIYPTNANDIPVQAPTRQVGVQIYTINGSGNLVDQERANFQTRLPIPTFTFPKGGVMVGVAWVPASRIGGVGKFYLYEGFGDTYCYTLTPSSLDFASCTWTWGRENFGGKAPVYKNTYLDADWQRLAAQGKFQYVSAKGVLMWHDGPNTTGVCFDGIARNGIVQFWNPPGTPI